MRMQLELVMLRDLRGVGDRNPHEIWCINKVVSLDVSNNYSMLLPQFSTLSYKEPHNAKKPQVRPQAPVQTKS